ncbi:MAG: cell division protein FtsA, partial [Marinomonas sp.]
MASGKPADRLSKVFAAVNAGSFRISAMIMGLTEGGQLQVLGSGHRASQGIKRGYITDMPAATYAIRDAVERAEKNANVNVQGVWIGCSGAGLRSQVSKVEIEIGGRRIEEEDIEQLLVSARQTI